jgi:hypothetical protein
MKKSYWLLLPLILLTFNSCIGISADIQIRRDGSARITLEYQISRMAETIGRLDGNELFPIIPVGRLDWERTVARLDGVRLVSFSSRERDRDVIYKVTLDFAKTEDLISFFGKGASFDRTNGVNTLSFMLSDAFPSGINSDLTDLFRQVCAGYTVSISFRARNISAMTLTDITGREIALPAGGRLVSSGRETSFSIDTAQIIDISDGLGVKITW